MLEPTFYLDTMGMGNSNDYERMIDDAVLQ